MERFETLSATDARYRQMLVGNLSAKEIAIPVQTLNLREAAETTTFLILNRVDVRFPGWARVLARAFRIELLALTLLPAVFAIAAVANQIVDSSNALVALLSLTFLHFGTFCLNDYLDHLSGVDRVNEKTGSRVIQSGWMTAIEMRTVGLGCWGLAVLTVVPLILQRPAILPVAMGTLLLLALGYRLGRWGSRSALPSVLLLVALFGPLLTTSIAWALTGRVFISVVAAGGIFGLLAYGYHFTRQMISMVVDDASGLATLPVSLGFDRARLVLQALVVLSAISALAYLTWLLPISSALVGAMILIPVSILSLRQIRLVRSPLSSALYKLPRFMLQLHLVFGLVLVFSVLMRNWQ